MAQIHVLSPDTINRIAAGEVVERPASVVKELVENAIDAGASAVTVEIRGGGMDLIRVTDNGSGIDARQVGQAFRRHATSKITDADDLVRLSSLGFRGEALSSIAAVAQVEMITKTRDSVSGIRARNDEQDSGGRASASGPSLQTADGIPMTFSEIGAPDGTTVIVRNLFHNVPVRRGFLRSAQTEAGYVTDLVDHFALSRPDISFHYRLNNQEKLHTTGSGDIHELIYRIYGREMARAVVAFRTQDENSGIQAEGYLGRPEFSRSSRSSELFFVNGRMLRSDVLSRGLEEGYRTDLMQHRFPFAILYLTIPSDRIDVNVHPSKMEVRFTEPGRVYDFLNTSVHEALHREELIPRESLDTKAQESAAARNAEKKRREQAAGQPHREPFERGGYRPGDNRTGQEAEPAEAKEGAQVKEPPGPAGSSFVFVDKTARFEQATLFDGIRGVPEQSGAPEGPAGGSAVPSATGSGAPSARGDNAAAGDSGASGLSADSADSDGEENAPRMDSRSDEPHLFTREQARRYRFVGQIFDTYWIIEYQDRMLMIDQHAAHEKVNFERLMKRLEKEQGAPAASQLLAPPLVVQLTGREEAALAQYSGYFARMGYEIDAFGENSYALRAVPLELYANEPDVLLREILDEIMDSRISGTPDAILYKIASVSCKAAIKGGTRMSLQEAQELIDELLELDNPYHCPHGRPTMIELTRSEVERKFRRIV